MNNPHLPNEPYYQEAIGMTDTKYREAMQFIGEGPDPLAAASEEDLDNNIDEFGWSITEEEVQNIYDIEQQEEKRLEDVKAWIAEHPDDTARFLAIHLDDMADRFGQGTHARFARIVATEAHKLHWLIIGSDEVTQCLTQIEV